VEDQAIAGRYFDVIGDAVVVVEIVVVVIDVVARVGLTIIHVSFENTLVMNNARKKDIVLIDQKEGNGKCPHGFALLDKTIMFLHPECFIIIAVLFRKKGKGI